MITAECERLPDLIMPNSFIAAECHKFGIERNTIRGECPKTFAQHGEDLIIASLLNGMCSGALNGTKQDYLDIGANHPIELSNTYLLYEQYGMSGSLVEAVPDRITDLTRIRPRDRALWSVVSASREETLIFNIANASELSSLDETHAESLPWAFNVEKIEVPNIHIQDLLDQFDSPLKVLSIDVEGADWEVLQAIDFGRLRPWIVCLEPFTERHPERGEQMLHLMFTAGYRLVAVTFHNMIFRDGMKLQT